MFLLSRKSLLQKHNGRAWHVSCLDMGIEVSILQAASVHLRHRGVATFVRDFCPIKWHFEESWEGGATSCSGSLWHFGGQ